jgi:predicted transcriptional regulator
MITGGQKITIIRIRRGRQHSVNDDIMWLGRSLGLFGVRDKDSSCYRLFIELLKNSKSNEPLRSDDLAYRLGLTRATVIHHLNRLIDTGIVIADHNRYILRVGRLEHLIDELRKDLLRSVGDLKRAAKEIDDELGL